VSPYPNQCWATSSRIRGRLPRNPQVLAYLGRYTNRVAIANRRLVTLNDSEVSFRWRDYRHQNKLKLLTLAADEFGRRFLLHTLPDGFHRIRHYGFHRLSCRRRAGGSGRYGDCCHCTCYSGWLRRPARRQAERCGVVPGVRTICRCRGGRAARRHAAHAPAPASRYSPALLSGRRRCSLPNSAACIRSF
jgi:putative transposase